MHRFAVLTAVSAERQVEDKDSLDDQLKNARAFGERTGWEFVKEYRVDGYSRTGYYDLTKAFENIPKLGELSRLVTTGKTDMIVVDSFDRLGSVGLAMWEWLRPYRVQLRSVQQATPVYDPEEYDPGHDESTYNQIIFSMMTNKYRTNKIGRAFEVGNARRARDGKHANHRPFPYIKTDEDTLVLDERAADLFRQFPSLFLNGETLNDLTRRANQSGVKPPQSDKWDHSSIRHVLKNPFYAGKTFYVSDELHDGNHEALWTWDTHLAIMQEFERRTRHRAKPTDYNLTKLLECAVCGKYLKITYSTHKVTHKYWRCRGHVGIRDTDANQQVADEIRRLFTGNKLPDAHQEKDSYVRREIGRLDVELKKVERAYYADAYTAEEFAKLKKDIERRRTELENTEHQQEEAHARASERQRVYSDMNKLLGEIDRVISKFNPRQVNYQLSRVLKFTAHPDRTIKAELITG